MGVLAGFPWHSVIPRAPAGPPPLPAFASTVPFLNFTAHFPSVFISCLHSTSHSLKLLLVLWQLFSSRPCSKLTSPKCLVTAISLLQIVTLGQGHQLPSASSLIGIICNHPNLSPSLRREISMLMLCLASGLSPQSVCAVCTQPEQSLESCSRGAEEFPLIDLFLRYLNNILGC